MTPLRRKTGIALLAALLLGAALRFAGPATATPTDRYLQASGSDTVSGGGSNDCTDPAHPCATIAHVMSVVAAGDTVHISGGIVMPDAGVAVTKDLTFVGTNGAELDNDTEGSRGFTIAPATNADPDITVSITGVNFDEVSTPAIDAEHAHLTLHSVVARSTELTGIEIGASTIDATDVTSNSNGEEGGPCGFSIGNTSGALHHVDVEGNAGEQGCGIQVGGTSDLTIDHSTIASNGGDEIGSGILANLAATGHLTVTDSVITRNTGPGVRVDGGTVTVTDSQISDNGAPLPLDETPEGRVGVLANAGTANLDRDTLFGNLQGGIYARGGTVDLTDSTVIGGYDQKATLARNQPVIEVQPGITATSGTVTASNSTITGSKGFGVLSAGGSVSFKYVTVTHTHPGTSLGHLSSAGLAKTTFSNLPLRLRVVVIPAGAKPSSSASLTAQATLDGDNDGVRACFGTITDAGYNLAADSSCGFTDNGVQNEDPDLGPLQNNGGTTLTYLPGAGSPVRDVIPLGSAGCVTGGTDQRGDRRPLNGRCDIGAVESAGGNLANTGIQTEQLLLIALALFLAGGGLLALTRRRR